MTSTSFDRHQFDHRPKQHSEDMLDASLTYDELHNSGSVFKTVGRSEIYRPAFYTNDAQLRAVLARAVVSYAFRSKRVPDNLQTDLISLQRIAIERQSRVEEAHQLWNATVEHVNAVRQAGSYIALLAAISYRAWRLGWHTEDIANEQGMTTGGVKRILIRLCEYATELGFQTYDRKQAYRGPDAVEVICLWRSGLTIPTIAEQLKCSPASVRHLLRLKKDMYVWNRNCSHDVPLKMGSWGKRFCPECNRIRQRESQRRYRLEAFLKTVAWG